MRAACIKNLGMTRVTYMVMPRVAWASDQRSAVLNRTVSGESRGATSPLE